MRCAGILAVGTSREQEAFLCIAFLGQPFTSQMLPRPSFNNVWSPLHTSISCSRRNPHRFQVPSFRPISARYHVRNLTSLSRHQKPASPLRTRRGLWVIGGSILFFVSASIFIHRACLS